MGKKIIRQNRANIKVGTIEQKYGVDLGVRSDMKLGNFLKLKGYPSFSRMLNDAKR